MKKIVTINLLILFLLIFSIELVSRFVFSYNVQGLSNNLLNAEINYNFTSPNLTNGRAFGAKIYTDENGFRIKKNNSLKIGSNDIIFVGGSVTFGPAIDAKNTFVEKLNTKSEFNVRNASVFGTTFENNIEIIKNLKNKKEIEKIFINFPLDDILSNKVKMRNTNKNENNLKKKLKSNKILSYINTFIRSKSASYVLVKNLFMNSRKNNYLHDINLYKNDALLKQLSINLIELNKVVKKNNIFFYSIPYAEQIHDENCNKNDGSEQILKSIFNKQGYEIIFLKKNFCEEKNPIKFFLKNDPVHLSHAGHNIVAEILENYLN